jgi:[acyl-carrier-protein] S-malonyltransferase
MIAALFPGQGFEEPNMARGFLDHPLVAAASEACGVDVRRALERWSPDLARTSVLQPTLVAVSLAAWEGSSVSPTGCAAERDLGLLRSAPKSSADIVCGHSVGEIAAWAASGGIAPAEAVRLAARRGAAMERAAASSPGGMVALDVDSVRLDHGLEVAARNSPRRVVLSGPLSAIEALGAKRLPVSGAWHSRAMRGLGIDWHVEERAPTRTLITCLDGSAVVRPDLEAQMTSPVRWDRVMESLVRLGVTRVAIFGPQKVMRALVRENAPALLDGVAA